MPLPAWHWDETRQVGVDYLDDAEVERYDARMATMRDVAAESRKILDQLESPARLWEIGCGTGEFSLFAAGECERVEAFDVSPVMLEAARRKAAKRGVTNVGLYEGGFLTLEPLADPPDAIVTQLALHHLPDFWKAVALDRLAGFLPPGARLHLTDVVYGFEPADHVGAVEAILADSPPEMRFEIARHVATEYSTLGWIQEGLLERAGFEILGRGHDAFLARYVCKRRPF